jgi:transposase
LILDNASFHKGGRIEEIAKSYGHVLMYLPPYSPELNPIERCWGVLKQKVRRLLSQGVALMKALKMVCSE